MTYQDDFPAGWNSAAVMPDAAGWYERRYSDGTHAHHWDGSKWSATKDGNAHWRQLADAPYPLWRPIPAALPPQAKAEPAGVSGSDRAELIQELFRIAMYGDRSNSEGTRARIGAALDRAILSAAPSTGVRLPLADADADRIHSMPWVRDCLLRYVDRPCDKEARDVVRAVVNAVNGLPVGVAAPDPVEQITPENRNGEAWPDGVGAVDAPVRCTRCGRLEDGSRQCPNGDPACPVGVGAPMDADFYRSVLRLIVAVEDRFGLEKARELAREALAFGVDACVDPIDTSAEPVESTGSNRHVPGVPVVEGGQKP